MTRALGKSLLDAVGERAFHLGRVVRGREHEATVRCQAESQSIGVRHVRLDWTPSGPCLAVRPVSLLLVLADLSHRAFCNV